MACDARCGGERSDGKSGTDRERREDITYSCFCVVRFRSGTLGAPPVAVPHGPRPLLALEYSVCCVVCRHLRSRTEAARAVRRARDYVYERRGHSTGTLAVATGTDRRAARRTHATYGKLTPIQCLTIYVCVKVLSKQL